MTSPGNLPNPGHLTNQSSNGVHQETEGLLSPLIRDVRLRAVAARVRPGAVVLDLACGAGFLGGFLPTGCRYYGVDRVPPPRLDRFAGFLSIDLSEAGAVATIQRWLGTTPDVVTAVAFLEHLKNPGEFVRRCRALLGPGGQFIGTTPHPRGHHLHEALARLYLCSRHGAEEHEAFLGRPEIEAVAAAADLRVADFATFLFGLNQLFVFAVD